MPPRSPIGRSSCRESSSPPVPVCKRSPDRQRRTGTGYRTALPFRFLYFVISYVLICVGIAISNRCKLPIIPTDLFPRELADITKAGYPKIKIGFDVACLAVTAALTFFCLGRLEGLGIGTILAAFTMGKGVGIVGTLLDRHFRFVSVLSKREEDASC